MSYTGAALLGIVAAVVLDTWVLRTRLLRRRIFWVSYAIIVFFQLITNGVLTQRGIVVYDPDAIIGVRLAYAPVEDLLFGFSLVTQTLCWWVWWGRRGVEREPVRVPPRSRSRTGSGRSRRCSSPARRRG